MTDIVRFKGGPIFLNSGGRGPDDYLLKPIKGGRWTLVVFRWGRHFTGSVEIANQDKEAMKNILPVLHMPISDNCERYYKMKKKANLPQMDASEFLEKYRDCPSYRLIHPRRLVPLEEVDNEGS